MCKILLNQITLFLLLLILSHSAFSNPKYEKELADLEYRVQDLSDQYVHLKLAKHEGQTKQENEKIEKLLQTIEVEIHGASTRIERIQQLITEEALVVQGRSHCIPAKSADSKITLKLINSLGKIAGFEFKSNNAQVEFARLGKEREMVYERMLQNLKAMTEEINKRTNKARSLRQFLISKMFCTGSSKSEYIRKQIEGFKRQDQYLQAIADPDSIEVGNHSGIASHPQKNSKDASQMMLKSGPNLLLSEYQKAEGSGKEAILDFFSNAFDHTYSCFEARYTGLSDHSQSEDSYMKVQLTPGMSLQEKIYEYFRVFMDKEIDKVIRSDQIYFKEFSENFSKEAERNGPKWHAFKLKIEADPKYRMLKEAFTKYSLEQLKQSTHVPTSKNEEEEVDPSIVEGLHSFTEDNDYLFSESE